MKIGNSNLPMYAIQNRKQQSWVEILQIRRAVREMTVAAHLAFNERNSSYRAMAS